MDELESARHLDEDLKALRQGEYRPTGDLHPERAQLVELAAALEQDVFPANPAHQAALRRKLAAQVASGKPLRRQKLVTAARSAAAILALVLLAAGLSWSVGRLKPLPAANPTAPTPNGQPTAAGPAPLELGKVAYIQNGDVWVKDLPGGAPRRLTTNGGASRPRISPSGEWVAFLENSADLWLLRTDGNSEHPLTAADKAVAPVDYAWSPTQDLLACLAGQQIFVAAPGQPARLLGDTGFTNPVGNLAWSPDGTSLAYLSGPAGASGDSVAIRQVSAQDGAVIHQTDLPAPGAYRLAGWTADGQSFTYWVGNPAGSASLAADGLALAIIPAAGDGQPVELASSALMGTDGVNFGPSGSPAVVYIAGGGRMTWAGKFLAFFDGSQPGVLTSPEVAAASPVISPDGRQIAYVSMPAASSDLAGGDPVRQALFERRITLYDLATGETHPLTSDPVYRDEHPQYSRDGQALLFARLDAQDGVSLWTVPAGGGEPQPVLAGLSAQEIQPDPGWFGSYGHLDWSSLYDWWRGPGSPSSQPEPTSEPTQELTSVPTPRPPFDPPHPAQPTSTPPPSGTPAPGAINRENARQVAEVARRGQGEVYRLAYAPDSSQVAVIGALGVDIYDTQAILHPGEPFDPAAPAPVPSLSLTEPLEWGSAAISPGWELLAVGAGPAVRVYHLPDGSPLRDLPIQDGKVARTTFSPDASLLAVEVLPPGQEVYNHLLQLYRVSDWTLLNGWDLGAVAGGGTAFSSDGKGFYAWNPVRLPGPHCWRIPDGRSFTCPPGLDTATTIASSPDGRLIAAAQQGVELFDATTGNRVRNLEGGPGAYAPALSFSPDGRLLAASSAEGLTRLWDVASGRLLQTLPAGNVSGAAAFSPDGTLIMLPSGDQVGFWTTAGGAQVGALADRMPAIHRLAVSPDEYSYAFLTGDGSQGQARLARSPLDQEKPTWEVQGLAALSLAYAPGSHTLAVGMWDGSVQLFRAADGSPLASLPGGQDQVQAVAFSPDGARLAAASMGGVRVYRLSDGSLERQLSGPGGWVTDLAFTPDGALLAGSSAYDEQVYIWQVGDGRLVTKIDPGQGSTTGALAFSPDGRLLAGAAGGRIDFWQVNAGWELARQVDLGFCAASTLAFSPDSSVLAEGSCGLGLWNAADGSLLTKQLAGNVRSLGFTPDGRYLLTGLDDGTLRVWAPK